MTFVRETPDGVPYAIIIEEVGSFSMERGPYLYLIIFGDRDETELGLDILGITDQHFIRVAVPPGINRIGPIPADWCPVAGIVFGMN